MTQTREKATAKMRRWRAANPEKSKTLGRESAARFRASHPEAYRIYHLAHLEERRKYNIEYNAAHREEKKAYRLSRREITKANYLIRYRGTRMIVLNHYGGKCTCCGENTYEFLCVDHINGGGNKHKKENGLSGEGFYRWIIRNNFPEDLQILCHNCNSAKGFYGQCPHERAKVIL